MNSLEVLSSLCTILLHFKAFSQGGGNIEVIPTTYIKEIHSDDKIPSLEENPFVNTQEKRLELCRGGFEQIQNLAWRLTNKNVLSEGSETGKLKFYIFMNLTRFQVMSLPAYKCPIGPDEIYIHVDSSNENEPILQVIHKRYIPVPLSGGFLYQMVRVINIVEVNSIDMMAMSKSRKGIPLTIPDLDTDEFTDAQRLQICFKGMQTCPGSNIELFKNVETMSKNKFYKLITFNLPWQEEERVMEAFECPTQPKIYISTEKRQYPSNVILLYVLIKMTEGERPTTDPRKLGAITTTTIEEDLYEETRDANTNTKQDQLIDSKTQDKICQTMFKNKLQFKILYLPSIETYNELKEKRPDLWTRFYKTENSESISGKDIITVSGPESTAVRVSKTRENEREDLFVCLIKSDAKIIEEYFFSKEYNMSNTKDPMNDFIAGRFIFKRNPNDNSAVLISIMEEFAKEIKTSNVELLYLERREQNSGQPNHDNLLCKLKSFERLRICTLVFISLGYPLDELDCAQHPVTFVNHDGEKKANGNQYYELMLPCHASSGRSGQSKVFYLSLAYDRSNPSSFNGAFTFSRASESTNIVLEKAYLDSRIGNLLTKKMSS